MRSSYVSIFCSNKQRALITESTLNVFGNHVRVVLLACTKQAASAFQASLRLSGALGKQPRRQGKVSTRVLSNNTW